MNHLPHTTHGNTLKERAMVSASPSRHRHEKKGGTGKAPASIVPSPLAPSAKEAVETQYDRALLTIRDWMTAAAVLVLSIRNQMEGSILTKSLLDQTHADGDPKSEAILNFVMGSNGLNLDFDKEMAVVMSKDNFDKCEFQLFKHGIATPGVASLLFEVEVGDPLADHPESLK